jgi:pyruvate dehydrogenase (quinone)
MIGLKGIYVDDPEVLGSAWDEALAAKRPVVLEVKTDPEVPPLPPHITLDQARKFSMSLMKGDSSAGSAVAGAARQLLGAILPDRQG